MINQKEKTQKIKEKEKEDSSCAAKLLSLARKLKEVGKKCNEILDRDQYSWSCPSYQIPNRSQTLTRDHFVANLKFSFQERELLKRAVISTHGVSSVLDKLISKTASNITVTFIFDISWFIESKFREPQGKLRSHTWNLSLRKYFYKLPSHIFVLYFRKQQIDHHQRKSVTKTLQ